MKRNRIERDALGELEVPADAYWGISTQRARTNFQISGQHFPPEFIRALALVKKACALTNMENHNLEKDIGDAILRALDEIIIDRMHLDQFPVDIYQTGSGTMINMNMNEVVSNRANEILGHPRGQKSPVHPNDHVNMSQSSNDVIPTAMQVTALEMINVELMPALELLMNSLDVKIREFRGIIKVGRTHLQDAVPIPLSMEFSVYRAQVMASLSQIQEVREDLAVVPLGGTAVGTGLNAPEGFSERAVAHLSRLSRTPLRSATVKAESISSHAAVIRLSGAIRGLALACMKMANDIRWMASGPRAGLAELRLPENEPGSSIMPGKVNPTQAEALIQVCIRVIGNDTTITLAEAYGSVLDLNVTKPLMIISIFESIRLLSNAIRSFVVNCLNGIEPNRERISQHLSESLMIVTRLVPIIGYDKTALIARTAYQTGKTIRQTIEELGIDLDVDLDEILDPHRMV